MKKIAVIFLSCIIMVTTSCNGKKSDTMNNNHQFPTTASSNIADPAVSVTPVLTDSLSEVPADASPSAAPDLSSAKLAALTFDDGPNTDITPLVLDKLEKYGVAASFFLCGKNLNDAVRPVLERQLKLGCELNNHSWSHPAMNTMTREEIEKEVLDTNNKINELTGVTPKFFRPPYIATSPDMYTYIDLPFICGIGCNDWEAAVSTEKRAEIILSTVKDGDIILLHDASANINTVNALDLIIPGMQDQGYQFVTISRLFELKGVEPDVENVIWTNVN